MWLNQTKLTLKMDKAYHLLLFLFIYPFLLIKEFLQLLPSWTVRMKQLFGTSGCDWTKPSRPWRLINLRELMSGAPPTAVDQNFITTKLLVGMMMTTLNKWYGIWGGWWFYCEMGENYALSFSVQNCLFDSWKLFFLKEKAYIKWSLNIQNTYTSEFWIDLNIYN